VRFEGVLKRVTISREADQWFASVLVKQQLPVAQPGEAVGVDLGVSVAALLS